MGQYVNAFGTSSFKDEKTIKDIEEKMRDLLDLQVYQLRTQNDRINFIINNLPSNEQNTILMDEIKKEQGQIRTEIEEMKKIFISINDIRFQTNFLEQQQQNLLTKMENLEKKNIQTEASLKEIKTTEEKNKNEMENIKRRIVSLNNRVDKFIDRSVDIK